MMRKWKIWTQKMNLQKITLSDSRNKNAIYRHHYFLKDVEFFG